MNHSRHISRSAALARGVHARTKRRIVVLLRRVPAPIEPYKPTPSHMGCMPRVVTRRLTRCRSCSGRMMSSRWSWSGCKCAWRTCRCCFFQLGPRKCRAHWGRAGQQWHVLGPRVVGVHNGVQHQQRVVLAYGVAAPFCMLSNRSNITV
jgi:hypothetical protein